jgi:hypothetical protein
MSAFERHLTPKEISNMWGWSTKTVIRRFRNEPGVLLVKRAESRTKRPYSQITIPESVMVKVHERYAVKKNS